MPCDMHISLCGVRLSSPVIAASGTYGFGLEYLPYFDPSCIGAVSFKALTPQKKDGNPGVRIAETAAGILNSIGLQNPGVEAFRREIYPLVREMKTRKIANVAGSCAEDYLAVVEGLEDLEIDMYELNVSCPNVRAGGMMFGRDPEAVFRLVQKVRQATGRPLIVKLTPNTGDIVAQAEAARDGGADAVSLINTLLGLAVDTDTRRPVLGNVTGGLSGPAIMPVALRMVREVCAAGLGLPVIGMGGISSGRDAAAFLMCGADAVMVGSATLRSPEALLTIARELREFAEKEELASVSQLVGTLKVEE